MTIMKSTCLLILPAAIAICADPGSISGKILTAAGNGAAVQNAPVEARNLETKGAYKAASAADGSYEPSGLSAGNYEVSIENMFPFLPFHRGGLRVGAGETTRLDIRPGRRQPEHAGGMGASNSRSFSGIGPRLPVLLPRAGDGKPDLSGVWEVADPKTLGEAPQPLPEAEAAAKQRGKRGRITATKTSDVYTADTEPLKYV